jgi:hypothetical protein
VAHTGERGVTGQRHDGDEARPDSVGGIAELYLGNILFALETAALTFEREQGPQGAEQASFYRGIARELAEARGRAKGRA